jgi:hypothetical protein
MQDVTVMNVPQSQNGLCEPLKHLLLLDRFPLPLCLLELLREVACLAEVHQDAKPPGLRETFAVLDDVWVFKCRQHLRLFGSIFAFLSGGPAHVYHLAYQLGPIRSFNKDGFAKRSFANFFDFYITMLPQQSWRVSVSHVLDLAMPAKQP